MADAMVFLEILDETGFEILDEIDNEGLIAAVKHISDSGGWESFKRAIDLKQLLEEVDDAPADD